MGAIEILRWCFRIIKRVNVLHPTYRNIALEFKVWPLRRAF